MQTDALVSCICPTWGRVPLLRRAVSCFLSQTYPRRELLVLYPAEDLATREYLGSLAEPAVRPMEIPGRRLSTGVLRNLGIECAGGHYVALWDDDDWYGPTRLAEQVGAMAEAGRTACVLTRVILYDETTQSAYMSAKRTWEASLVAERSAVPAFPDLARGSDTPVIVRMMNEGKLTGLDRPELYIYIYHGRNTWNRAHWETNLLPFGRPLPAEAAGRVISLVASDPP